MPAYKAAYLKDAVDSILNQTYKNFQLIVSDDCSPEDLKSIITQFNDNRISYRCNENNIGGTNLVAHWNLLLGLAQSEYVILAPDDDVYAPTFLEEIDRLTYKYPNVNIFKSRMQKVDAAMNLIMHDRLYEEYITQLDNLYLHAMPDYMSGIGNYVFKTEALMSIGGFIDYPLAWWSDVMTTVILSENGLVTTQDILFTMRMSGISITTRKASMDELRKKAEATMRCIEDVEKLIAGSSYLSVYDQQRIALLRDYFTQWLTDDLLVSAPAYSYKEMKFLIKKYPQVFSSKINKLLFAREWANRLFNRSGK